ncbi:cyclic pyranopterin monophosphate synthase subunit MoaA [Sediminitomix flava]|uniref:Cyclic pyranopterin monophosphate synthase subunit MoaA n=2 Tax=Sediminitomix flava TaxID=379075 RepID=A0A315ZHP4_SEDFL|nr:cyclic pyranopterin monophosphate synthase subunit MoaA [Sediminitomix flava]
MPENVEFSPSEELMQTDEIEAICHDFVKMGVRKIRITGGEPLARKDIDDILLRLAKMPVSLHMTTNGVLVSKHQEALLKSGIESINVSLDSLNPKGFHHITRRNDFEKVMEAIEWLKTTPIKTKVNVVLMRGENDHEITDFADFAIQHNLDVRFIEFMPFQGNEWSINKRVSHQEVVSILENHLGNKLQTLAHQAHETSTNFKIEGTSAIVGLISTVSQPFCGDCNRLRLTADGKMKNCLFSDSELDLLSAFRNGTSIQPIVRKGVMKKRKERGGKDFNAKADRENNRSMVRIGG